MEDGQVKIVEPPTTLVFDSMQSVTQAVRDGNGIGWSLRPVIADDLEAGRLETVLDRYIVKLPPFYLYYPEQNRRLGLLRLFIEFLNDNRKTYMAHLR
jgi:DNA-binding transcriptional LysR family regulator